MTAWSDLTVVTDDLSSAAWACTVRDRVINPFASTATRDATIASGDRVAGMVTFQTDTNTFTVWTGAAWADMINAQVFTPVRAVAAANGTTTSTSYTSTLSGVATPLSLAFVAKRAVHVIKVGATILQTTTGPWTAWMAPVVTGSGFSTYGPVDDDAQTAQQDDINAGAYGERTSLVSGLTPGVTYTVTPQFKAQSAAGTANFRDRTIIVM